MHLEVFHQKLLKRQYQFKVKRTKLLQHLRRNGCIFKREGTKHSLWINPRNGITEAIPRHVEIPNKLVIKITKRLEIPQPLIKYGG